MKKAFLTLVIFVVSIAVLMIGKDLMLETVVAGIASKIVGAPVKMKKLSFSLTKSTIDITGFEIGNPPGFPKGILVSIPVIKVSYDRAALLKRKLHVYTAEIDVRELGLIKNKDGELNIDSLAVVKKGAKETKKSERTPFVIDELILGIGNIVHKDYTQGEEPRVKVNNLNIHKKYKNITSPEQLAILILAEPVKAAGIQGAKIYGVALLTGGSILPVAAAFTLTKKDNREQIVEVDFARVYAISKEVAGRMGKITQEDASRGRISATVNGANVTVALEKKSAGQTLIKVSARKFMLPKPDVAGGVLYQIIEKL